MRSVVDQLWPEKPKSNSYFSLVQRFLGVVPRINAMKRSGCIEGSRMALARVKAHWAEMDATTVAAQGSAIGRVAAKEARSKIRATKEELNQPADIVSGTPFLLQTKFGDPKYAPLDRLWCSVDAYMNLDASVADAAE